MVKRQELTVKDYYGLENTIDMTVEINELTNVYAIKDELKSRFIACLLGLAIGDSKGMPAESKSVDEAEYVANTFDYLDGYLPAGSYTDDTNHAILLAESLIKAGGMDVDIFMQNMSNMDLGRGYGPTTLKSVTRFLQTGLAKLSGHETPGDGPSMRVAPVALLYYYDYELLKKKVIESAICTHTMPEAVAGALSVAFSIAYMLNNFEAGIDMEEYRQELIKFIKPISSEVADSFKKDAELMKRHGCRVLEAVPYSIKAVIDNPDSYEDTITASIKGAGDADTIAAMAGAISGALNGVTNIPKKWIDGLENDKKGKAYIVALAEKLYEVSQKLQNQQQ